MRHTSFTRIAWRVHYFFYREIVGVIEFARTHINDSWVISHMNEFQTCKNDLSESVHIWRIYTGRSSEALSSRAHVWMSHATCMSDRSQIWRTHTGWSSESSSSRASTSWCDICLHTHTHTQTCRHIHACKRTRTCIHTHTQTHTHACARAHTHTCTHARTHARTRTHARIHARTHTHIYTYSCRAGLFLEIQGSFNDIQGSFMMRRESTCVSGLMCVYQIRVTLCSSRAVLQLQCAVHNVYQNQQKSPRYPLQSSPSRALYIFNT